MPSELPFPHPLLMVLHRHTHGAHGNRDRPRAGHAGYIYVTSWKTDAKPDPQLSSVSIARAPMSTSHERNEVEQQVTKTQQDRRDADMHHQPAL
jgi:hypothetical protein